LHEFEPLQAFFGVWQSDLPLQLLTPKQRTLPAGDVALAGVDTPPASAIETAATATAAPFIAFFFIFFLLVAL
jgi:hypothetical protein